MFNVHTRQLTRVCISKNSTDENDERKKTQMISATNEIFCRDVGTLKCDICNREFVYVCMELDELNKLVPNFCPECGASSKQSVIK